MPPPDVIARTQKQSQVGDTFVSLAASELEREGKKPTSSEIYARVHQRLQERGIPKFDSDDQGNPIDPTPDVDWTSLRTSLLGSSKKIARDKGWDTAPIPTTEYASQPGAEPGFLAKTGRTLLSALPTIDTEGIHKPSLLKMTEAQMGAVGPQLAHYAGLASDEALRESEQAKEMGVKSAGMDAGPSYTEVASQVAPFFVPGAGLPLGVAQMGGSAYANALAEGASPEAARLKGALIGAAGAAAPAIIGAVSKPVAAAVSPYAMGSNRLAQAVGGAAGGAAANTAFGAAEGLGSLPTVGAAEAGHRALETATSPMALGFAGLGALQAGLRARPGAPDVHARFLPEETVDPAAAPAVPEIDPVTGVPRPPVIDANEPVIRLGQVGRGLPEVERTPGTIDPTGVMEPQLIERAGERGHLKTNTPADLPAAEPLVVPDETLVQAANEVIGQTPKGRVIRAGIDPLTGGIRSTEGNLAEVSRPVQESQPATIPQMPALEQPQVRLDKNGRAEARASGASPEAETIQPKAPSGALDKALGKSSPRYNYGDKPFEVRFDSPADKAAYILAGKGKSAKHDDILKAAQAEGHTLESLTKRGQDIRAQLKAEAKESTGPILTVRKAQETPNAGEVRSNQAPIPEQGIRPGEGENARGQDIQQPAQEGPKASNEQAGLTELGVTEKGVKVQSDGKRIYLNGADMGPDTPVRRANALRGGKPVEAKPLQAEAQQAGISPQAVAAPVKGAVGLGRSLWGDQADRLRGAGAPELAEKVNQVSRRAKELIGESNQKIHNLAQGAASVSRPTAKAMEVNPQGRSVFFDAVEGRIPVPSGLKKAVEAVWEANRTTADWFRKAGLTRADGSPFVGFKNGQGMVRQWTPEFDAITSGRLGDKARTDLINDLARRNNKTPQDIENILAESTSLSDVQGTIRRDPMEFARSLHDVPQYTKVNGKDVQILDLDPARYVKSLTQQAANRVAFGEHFGQKFDVGGDIAAQLKAQGVNNPKVLDIMTDAVRSLHAKDFNNQQGLTQRALNKLQETKEAALTPQVARMVDRATAAGLAVTKTANLTASAVGNITGILGQAGTVPVKSLAKGIIQVITSPKKSSQAATAEGSVIPDLYRFHDTAGMPETVAQTINATVGRPAHWANRFAALTAANAGRSWSETMAQAKAPASADIARLRALGFGVDEASQIAAGKGTPEQYKQVIREVVTATNAVNATRAQQSVLQNYGLFRRYGPAFATFAEQQARNFTRLTDIAMDNSRPWSEQRAALGALGSKVLGLTVGGGGALLATAYLRGGSKGVAEETEKPATQQVADYMWKGLVGGSGQAAIMAMEKASKPGKLGAADLAKIASYPVGKAIDLADAVSVLGIEPSPVMGVIFNQAPGAKIAKDAIGWMTAERTPARTMAVSNYYKWAIANPNLSSWRPSSGASGPLTLPVNKMAKAIADGDKPRQRELLIEAMQGIPEVVKGNIEKSGEAPKKIGPEMVGMALDNRRLLRQILDVKTMELKNPQAYASLLKAVGRTTMNELIVNDFMLNQMSEMLK